MPCPPEDVQPILDCSTNTARVEWQPSRGADFYILQAFGVEEHESGCETDTESCVLADLMCGFTYNISVIAVNSVCNVSQSAVTQLKAGKDSQKDLTFWGLAAWSMSMSQIDFVCGIIWPILILDPESLVKINMSVQCPVYRSRWRPAWFVSPVLWRSLGSPAKERHHTPQSPRATAAMRQLATAALQHACSAICCAASTTPSLFTLQMRPVAALEALLWSSTQV